jgi:hydrogenase small subunit
MPGFPDRFMPFMKPSTLGTLAARGRQFSYGPILKRLRRRAVSREFDVEPGWRRPGVELESGYQPPWTKP